MRFDTETIRSAREVQEALLPSDGKLEIVSIDFTKNAELDVKMRNLSDDTIYITRITIQVLDDRGVVLPSLNPSARYVLPIGSLRVGQSKSLPVSHIIGPHEADRILIALETTRMLKILLIFQYNRNYSISEEYGIWFYHALKSDEKA